MAVSKLSATPSLRLLDLSWCVSLVHPRLRNLTVTKIIAKRCSGLTNVCLNELLRNQSLVDVDLAGCRRLNSRRSLEQPKIVVDLFTQFCQLFTRQAVGTPPLLLCSTHLRVISFARCDAIDDGHVTSMFEACPSLEEVDLRECFSLNEPRIQSARLARITLAYCTRISDEVITMMFGGCPQLQQVSLAGCHQLRAPVMQSAATLLELNLQGCDQLDLGVCRPNAGPKTVLLL